MAPRLCVFTSSPGDSDSQLEFKNHWPITLFLKLDRTLESPPELLQNNVEAAMPLPIKISTDIRSTLDV